VNLNSEFTETHVSGMGSTVERMQVSSFIICCSPCGSRMHESGEVSQFVSIFRKLKFHPQSRPPSRHVCICIVGIGIDPPAMMLYAVCCT
jgi:hypothetical protein